MRLYLPELRRNGFTGKTYELTPFRLIHGLLTCNRLETLLKAGQIALLSYFANCQSWNIANYWSAIRISLRNGYIVSDASVWRDYIDT